VLAGLTAISILAVVIAVRAHCKYGRFREAYGVYWDSALNMRCLGCKKPLKFSSYDASVLHCSDRKCDSKHTLRTNDGNKLTRQQAIELMKTS